MSNKSMRDMVKLGLGEEIANCITHGVMAICILFILPAMAIYSYNRGGTIRAVGVSIFLICLLLMFLVSTLYHCMPFKSNHKYVFRKLDHICIYFAIAGSYTPIALCVIKGYLSVLVLGIEWSAVIAGILLKSISTKSYPKLSMTIYMIMGWVAILFIPALIQNTNLNFLAFIILGGVMYTIGAFFYSQPRKKYFHSIWHVCINLASIAHMIAIIFYM